MVNDVHSNIKHISVHNSKISKFVIRYTFTYFRGKTPQEAVKTFLRKIRELETYGIKQYDVKYDDSACQLGLSPQGVSLFRRNRRIFVYDWMMVSQISFKAKKFIVMIEKEIVSDCLSIFLSPTPLSLSLSLPLSLSLSLSLFIP